MIGINSEDTPSSIESFVATHGFTFPILRDNQAFATTGHYGVRSWSEFRLLDKQGERVRFRLLDSQGNPLPYTYFHPGVIEELLDRLDGSAS